MFCEKAGAAICKACRDTTGVREMPPARRRTEPCKRCNHTRLIRAIPRELSVEATRKPGVIETNYPMYAPMYATYPVHRKTETHVFSPDTTVVEPAQTSEGLGMLEMYICKRCGFVEWFCLDPAQIPIGPQFMTEEVDSESEQPYR